MAGRFTSGTFPVREEDPPSTIGNFRSRSRVSDDRGKRGAERYPGAPMPGPDVNYRRAYGCGSAGRKAAAQQMGSFAASEQGRLRDGVAGYAGHHLERCGRREGRPPGSRRHLPVEPAGNALARFSLPPAGSSNWVAPRQQQFPAAQQAAIKISPRLRSPAQQALPACPTLKEMARPVSNEGMPVMRPGAPQGSRPKGAAPLLNPILSRRPRPTPVLFASISPARPSAEGRARRRAWYDKFLAVSAPTLDWGKKESRQSMKGARKRYAPERVSKTAAPY